MFTKQLPNIISRIVFKLGRGTSPHTDGELNDLSYDDALLDVEIRSFMRAEYGKKVPPAGVFHGVVRAIRLYQQAQKRGAEAGPTSRFGELLGSLLQACVATYRVGTRPDMGRIMSGSMVAALLL